MIQLLKKYGKEIAKSLAVSLFFSAFFITLVGITFQKPIQNAITLVNKLSFVPTKDTNEIKIDQVKKRLVKYPTYGTIWATLQIPDIQLKLSVYHGDSLNLLRYGVGHYAGSYFPGEGGSVLFAAHNSAEYFRRLPELKVGSKIIVSATYGTYTYEVMKSAVIHQSEIDKLPITDKEELLMLYTCYPVTEVGLTSQRYVVYAKLVGRKDE